MTSTTSLPLINVADLRALFPGLRDTIYLNTATMAIGSAAARDAYVGAVERWAAGRFDWIEADRAGDGARAMFAQIVGAPAEDVAIVPAVSAAAGTVAANLPPARRGENVIVAGNEFSSNYFPWLLLRERGYDVRVVPSTDNCAPADAFAELADDGTRLVAVSAVHSLNGYRADLAALSRIAARSRAWFFVDACQAAGAVPLDVIRDGVDFLAAASHKFLLGSRGMGYLYVRRGLLDRIRPSGAGWKAARKPLDSFYGPGMELSPDASKLDASQVWFAALAERSAQGIFRQFGIGALLQRNAELSKRLHDQMAAHVPGFRPFPEEERSTIVSVPVADVETAITRLRDGNIVASVRGGRVRVSVHFYNLEEEIDRAAEVLGGGG